MTLFKLLKSVKTLRSLFYRYTNCQSKISRMVVSLGVKNRQDPKPAYRPPRTIGGFVATLRGHFSKQSQEKALGRFLQTVER